MNRRIGHSGKARDQAVKLWLVFMIGSVCALCLAFLLTGRAREPSYNGRLLHAWINDITNITFRITSTNGVTLEETNASIAAILNTQPDPVPWLKRELNARESAVRKKLRTIAQRLPQKIAGNWAIERYDPSRPTPGSAIGGRSWRR